MGNLEHVFSPVMVNQMEVKNRIFMSAMSTSFAHADGSVSEETINYYASRAKGGVGLMVTEVVMTEPVYKYLKKTLTLQDDSFIEGWKKLCDAVHKNGGRIAPQLLHPAFMALPLPGTPPLVAPAAVGPYYYPTAPRELKKEELPQLVENFGKAAFRAKTAGCDAVEIHAAHAHGLLGGFLSPLYNKRLDEYGQDVDGRLRLTLEVIREVRKTCGRDFPVIVRISGDDYEVGGQSLLEGVYISKQLEKEGADLIHVSGGTTIHRGSSITPPGTPQASHYRSAEAIKAAVSIPVATVGRVNEGWLLDEIIANGKADVCMVGRPILCDPEWVNKIREGKKEEIRPCIGCLGCLSSVMLEDHVTCSMNPSFEIENEDNLKPAAIKKKILVIGGGPAGMEAAYVLDQRGHEVTLTEKLDHLGGQMVAAGYPIAKNDILKAVKYFIHRLESTNVKVMLETEADEEFVRSFGADEVILAAGARPVVPQGLLGHKKEVIAEDILLGRAVAGKRVAIIGGGSVGAETADFIAPLVNDRDVRNRKIFILEMLPEVVTDDKSPGRSLLVRRLLDKGVELITNARVTKVGEDSLTYATGEEEHTLACDTVILACGYQSENRLAEALTKAEIPFYNIGDSVKPGKIKEAVTSAYQIAKNL